MWGPTCSPFVSADLSRIVGFGGNPIMTVDTRLFASARTSRGIHGRLFDRIAAAWRMTSGGDSGRSGAGCVDRRRSHGAAALAVAVVTLLSLVAPTLVPPAAVRHQVLRHVALASGGPTWALQRTTPTFADVSCVDGTDCVTVGNAGDGNAISSVTTNGYNWTATEATSITTPFKWVTCASTSNCWASTGTGSNVWYTTTSGSTWSDSSTEGALPVESGHSTADTWAGKASCPSTTVCFVPIHVAGSTTPGVDKLAYSSSWAWTTPSALPSGATSISGLSCPSASVCVATGAESASPYVFYYGGSTWTAATTAVPWGSSPGTETLNGVSCPTTGYCELVASDNNGGFTDDSTSSTLGATWANDSSGANALMAVSCWANDQCEVTGGNILYENRWAAYGGGTTSWTTQLTNPNPSIAASILGSVSCAAQAGSTTAWDCYAVDDGGLISDTGTTSLGPTAAWATVMSTPLPPPYAAAGIDAPVSQDSACPSPMNCYYIGQGDQSGNDEIYHTNTGGAIWDPAPLHVYGGNVSVISCPSVSTCYAAAGGIYSTTPTGYMSLFETTDYGNTWTDISPYTSQVSIGPVRSMSCVSTALCVMGSYGPTQLPYLASDIAVMSGSSWTTLTFSSGGYGYGTVTGMSCLATATPATAANTECFASLSDGDMAYALSNITTQSSWHVTSMSALTGTASGVLNDIACNYSAVATPPTACTAVGSLGTTTDTGTGQIFNLSVSSAGVVSGSIDSFSPSAAVTSVACPTRTTCQATSWAYSQSGFGVGSGSPAILEQSGGSWANSSYSGSVNGAATVACWDSNDCFVFASPKPNTVANSLPPYGVQILTTTGIPGPANGVDQPATFLGGPMQAGSSFGGADGSAPCFSCFLQSLGAPAQDFLGDPVDTATGDYTESVPMFKIPARGLPFGFALSYDAQLAQQEVSGGATSPGPFGWGWTATEGDLFLTSGPGTNQITVHQEDGSEVTFQGPTTYTPIDGTRITSTLTLSGSVYTFTRDGSNQVYTFNSGYQLTSEADANGNTTSFSYFAGGTSPCPSTQNGTTVSSCEEITDPAGRNIMVLFNSSHVVFQVWEPPSGGTTLTWLLNVDGNGNLSQITDPRGNSTQFSYDTGDSNSNLVHDMWTMTPADNVGNSVIRYDTQGRVYCQIAPAEEAGGVTACPSISSGWAWGTTFYTYLGNNAAGTGGDTQIQDPHGNLRVDAYTDNVLTLTITGANTGSPSTTVYARFSSTLMPHVIIDPDGHKTVTTFDANGNPLTIQDGNGNTTTYTYNSFNEPLTKIDPDTVSDPTGLETVYTYNADGNLTQKKVVHQGSGLSDLITNYTVCTTSCPSGYGPGDVESVQDPRTYTTTFTYDTYGDVASSSITAGSQVITSSSSYDPLGQMYCTVSPDANAASVACPSFGSTRVADTTTTVYDGDGNVTSTENPDAQTTSYVYDADNNQTTVTAPTVGSTTNVTKTVYDADDRPTQVTAGYGSSSAASTYRGYDLQPASTGNCLSSVSAATYCTTTTDGLTNVTTNYFNGSDQLTETTPPNPTAVQPTTYTYDPAGLQLSVANASGVTNNGYDAAGRLTCEQYASSVTPCTSASVSYNYDTDGLRETMVDSTGTTSYTYDGLRRLSTVQNGAGSTVGYGYDNDGDVTSIAYPGSGHTLTRTYDAADRMSTSQDWLSSTVNFSYDPDGNLQQSAFPGSTSIYDTYDNADQIQAVNYAPTGYTSVPIAKYAYANNADGQIASEADSTSWLTSFASQSTSYAYDANSRLTQTQTAGPNPTYGYNTANQLTGLTTGAAQTFNTDSQLTAAVHGTTTSTYGYNLVGQRTSSAAGVAQPNSYGYDQAGNMTSMSHGVFAGQVSAGWDHTLAVQTNGNVEAWGYNGNGQLGNGANTTNATTPQPVTTSTGLTKVVAVAAGGAWNGFSVALDSSGNVWMWGYNGDGERGNGTTSTTAIESPQQITAISNVVAIAAGQQDVYALKSDGTVWAWGFDYYGEIGNGTNSSTPVTTPTQVSNLSDVTSIAAGGTTAAAIESNGKVFTWGYGGDGEMGNGTTTGANDTPAQVTATSFPAAAQVAVGADHLVFLGADNTVWAWGANSAGQLGTGNTTSQLSPVPVKPGSVQVDALAVAAGGSSSMIEETDNNVYSFGSNSHGELGLNNTTNQDAPQKVSSSPVSPAGLTVGGYHYATILRADGTAVSAGDNSDGQLGIGTTTNSQITAPVLRFDATAGQVSAGWDHTLVLNGNGTVDAYGYNGQGQLGNNTLTDSTTPVVATGVASGVAVAAGDHYSLALDSAGHVWAWGDDTYGQLDNGTATATPVESGQQVSGLSNIVAVAAGYNSAMALDSSGNVWTWGSNYDGQIGNGTTSSTPVTTAHEITASTFASGITITAIAAGGYHNVALGSNGVAYTWGYNNNGQIGNGTITTQTTPIAVTTTGATIQQIAAGGYQTLLLDSGGNVWAFGSDNNGQLGDGCASCTGTYVSTPEKLTTVIGGQQIAAGGYHSLIEKNTGAVWAAGMDTYGELGDNNSGTPATVSTPVLDGALVNPAGLSGGGYHSVALQTTGAVEGWGSDANGRLGNGATTTAVLTPVTAGTLNTSPAATTATYAYNGDGLRMAKTIASSAEQYTWDTTTAVPQILVDGTTNYIYGPDGHLLEQITSAGTAAYIVTDAVGSVRAIFNSGGTSTYAYDSYGNLIAKDQTGTATTPFGYAGAYTDTESGLLYLTHRYYDPTTGQFLTVDPLVAQTGEPYGYTNDNPVNKSDPAGLGAQGPEQWSEAEKQAVEKKQAGDNTYDKSAYNRAMQKAVTNGKRGYTPDGSGRVSTKRNNRKRNSNASDTPWWAVAGGVIVGVVTAPVWLPCLAVAAVGGLVLYGLYSLDPLSNL